MTRRIVTGWNDAGDPAVLFDGEAPGRFDFGQASSIEIWSTAAVPADVRRIDDPTLGGFRVEPPLGGTVCRIASYRPGASVEVHSTQTLDYIIVISGELTMLFEDREYVLGPGDSVVQQATPHGWANRGDVDCVVVAVLITAEGASDEGRVDWP